MTHENDKTLPPDRLVSLDTYRGMTMLLMASFGFGTWELAGQDWAVGNPRWRLLLGQLNHLEWHGCTLWDLIFPSFLFVIGVFPPDGKRRGDHSRQCGAFGVKGEPRGFVPDAFPDRISHRPDDGGR